MPQHAFWPVNRVLTEVNKLKQGHYVLHAVLSRFSHVWLFATLWTIVRQAPLSMGFTRQEHWRQLPFPSPGDLPDPGIEPASIASPALVGVLPGKPHSNVTSALTNGGNLDRKTDMDRETNMPRGKLMWRHTGRRQPVTRVMHLHDAEHQRLLAATRGEEGLPPQLPKRARSCQCPDFWTVSL